MADRRQVEKQGQAAIVGLAKLFGWRVYHTFDSRRSEPGFPDLVLVRERVVYAEIKQPGKQPRAEQVEWLNALAAAGQEVYVWTVDDAEEIRDVLQRRAA